MVFFTCNHCGESVKKPSVEKHYNTKCRSRDKSVSCMDCQKDFHGEEYVAHTKCISELEKYSGKNFVARESQNSGQKKQETWMDIVRSILESQEYNLSAQTRNIFQRLQSYDNVPRKKAKFQNFVANCMRIPAKQAEPVWAVLEKELENMKKLKQQEMAAAKKAQEEAKNAKEAPKQQNGVKRKAEEEEEGVTNGVEKKKKTKKTSTETEKPEENGNGLAEPTEESEEFQWSTVLEKIVAKNAEGITMDKLKKKLLKKYKSKLSLEELTEKQQKKFEKKFAKTLKKCPAIQVDNEIAKPC
uniref:Zinc finger C2H2 LYAR-type domain-containing protein n=1 Tax=Stomoxys calcitrans TaxID=35570 RepID=A0A1I8Q0J8_STOCA